MVIRDWNVLLDQVGSGGGGDPSHPDYENDMPDLTLIFENGIV